MISSDSYKKLPQIIATILCLLSIATSEGAIITWQITGTVYEVSSALSSKFAIGNELNASLTFDTSTPDNEPGIPYRGKYINAANMSASIAGYTATADQMYLILINDFIHDGSDRFLTSTTSTSNTSGESIGDYNFGGFSLLLQDNNGGMFSSIELPVEPPSSSFFEKDFLYMSFLKSIAPNTYLGASVRANNLQLALVEVPTLVPEPSAITLMGLGLLGLFGVSLRNLIVRNCHVKN